MGKPNKPIDSAMDRIAQVRAMYVTLADLHLYHDQVKRRGLVTPAWCAAVGERMAELQEFIEGELHAARCAEAEAETNAQIGRIVMDAERIGY